MAHLVSGMPGSIIGAYLVETALGRKGTLASSTLLTAVGVLLFVLISSQAVRFFPRSCSIHTVSPYSVHDRVW